MTVEQIKIVACAALLEQANKIHYCSLSISLASVFALLILVISWTQNDILLLGLLLLIVLGLLETYMAIRTGFDARLLNALAKDDSELESQLQNMDQALIQLKLMPEQKAGRNLDLRLLSCMKLFRMQILLCGLQLLVILLLAIGMTFI